jgi:hypothetical protein
MYTQVLLLIANISESSSETTISGNLSTANKRLSPGNFMLVGHGQDSNGEQVPLVHSPLFSQFY